AESHRARLVEERAAHHAVLDAIGVAVVTSNDDGAVTFVNRRARELLGLDRSAGGAVEALLGLAASPRALLGAESSRTLSYAHATGATTTLDLDLFIARVAPIGEAQRGFVFVFHDAEAHEGLSVERRRSERLVAMETMVAGFAHEVRNPVAALLSMVAEVADALEAAGIELPHVARMVHSLQRLERLVRASLQFGRPAAPRRGRHPPSSIIMHAVADVGPRTRASGEELRVEIEPELPDVLCDDEQITRAVVILLNNALDATGSPARVRVRALLHEPRQVSPAKNGSAPADAQTAGVRLEVVDDGPGIPPESLSRVFDPFFTTKPTGTGLGLSIAQQVVSENRGHLEVVSSPGGPTTFSIWVPLHS
ncbi:MAG TPA: ATP-binding protein, partial [Polyangiaceae bacterium]|nr:ATP-binding protein [Polyangiaceae bacterium]